MCIIIYKPAGVKMPSQDILENCWWVNSDGAGFMYPLEDKGLVKIRKGFMNLHDLEDALAAVPNSKNIPMVIHFRIGTQGWNDARNTHPFPITTDSGALGARSSVSRVALAHNGIIPLTTSYSTYKKGEAKETRSDTFYFVRDYASLIIEDVNYYEMENNVKLLKKLAESKLAIMGGDGHVELIGDFIYDKHDKCHYSNSSYEGWYRTALIRQYSGTALHDDTEDWERYYEEKYGKPEDGRDANGDEYNVVSSIDGTKGTRRVRAAFLPATLFVLSEETGILVGGDTDDFVYDIAGNIYIYDRVADGLIKMNGYKAVNDNLDEQDCSDDKTSVLMAVIDEIRRDDC